jgi:hypothetical protein
MPSRNRNARIPTCAWGTDVFGFAISQAPKSIRSAPDAAGWHIDDIDHVVLHQSNRMINETIRKKVSYPAEKAPSTLEQIRQHEFGLRPADSNRSGISSQNGAVRIRCRAVLGHGNAHPCTRDAIRVGGDR